MVRSILRNIQFYLLISSALLALIALQHLNWYDSSILSHPAVLDKPSFGSPDDTARGTLYYGDESKEIGIFKFKVGLFKFALPTFAKDELIWEDREGGSKWKTVPVPPNRLRKNMNRREIKKTDIVMKQQKKVGAQSLSGTSVAYVVIIPVFHHLQSSSFYERATVLAASIKKAHGKSSDDYKLYAINFVDKSHPCSDDCTENLNRLGYDIVDVSISDLDEAVDGRQSRLASSSNELTLDRILTNNIVVHLSLSSFLLKPIDKSVFEQIDSGAVLALKPATTTTTATAATENTDEQLYIIKSSSKEARTFYLKLLKCFTNDNIISTKSQTGDNNASSSQRRDAWQPTLYPRMRKLLSSVPKSVLKIVDSEPAHRGEQSCTITKRMTVLDRCIYAIGSDKCNAVQEYNDVVAALFGEECLKPWECEKTPSGDGCIGTHSQDKTAHCEWLQQKWFALLL